MKYSTYKEEFLEAQVKLVNQVTKDWPNYGYPNADQLKEAYSRENFTADTRHYIFKEDNLIGFVASAIENKEGEVQYGSIQFPFVNVDDKKKKVEIELDLMNKAKESLKSNGVHVIRSFFSDEWPIADIRSMYEEKDIVQRSAQILNYRELSKADYSKSVRAVDMEKDMQIFHKGLINQFKEMTEEQMVDILKRGAESNGFVERMIAIENDMVVAQGRISIFEDQAFLILFAYHESGVKYKKDIISALLKEVANNDEISEVRLTHTYSDAAPEAGFEGLGLKFTKTIRFEIAL